MSEEKKSLPLKTTKKKVFTYQVKQDCFYNGLKRVGDVVETTENLPSEIYKKM